MDGKPEILIVSDEDIKALLDGMSIICFRKIDCGGKEYGALARAGKLQEISQADANGRRDIAARRNYTGTDILVLNPYTQMYWPLAHQDLENKLIADKSYAISRALKLCGAHCAILSETAKQANESSRHLNVSGGYKISSAEVDTTRRNSNSTSIASSIAFCDPNNKAASFDRIDKYVRETGLINEPMFNYILRDIQDGQRIGGVQRYQISYLSELKESLNVVVDVRVLFVKAGIDIDEMSSNVHAFTKELWVYWDDVPMNVQSLFSAGQL